MGLSVSFMAERGGETSERSRSVNGGTNGSTRTREAKSSSITSSISSIGSQTSHLSDEFMEGVTITGGKGLNESESINWEKGGLIGQGAFGKVYLGLNQDTGELMAVKQFDLMSNLTNEEAEDNIIELQKEIDMLSHLNHLNIVRYYGAQKTEENLNIFLEYVSGGSIHFLVKKFGRLSESVISVYSKQILLGLHYLHENNIIHRDIKGANILVDNTGVIKLADFGASKQLDDILGGDKDVQSLRGSPYWMAPEVVRQEGQDKASDIWSVACTMVEMATAKPPWCTEGESPHPISIMYQIARAKEGPPLPDNLSPNFVSFLKQCFKANPRDRPTVSQLLTHPFIYGTRRGRRLSDVSVIGYEYQGVDVNGGGSGRPVLAPIASPGANGGPTTPGKDNDSFQLIEKSLKSPKDHLYISRTVPSHAQDAPMFTQDTQPSPRFRIQSPRRAMNAGLSPAVQSTRKESSNFNFTFDANSTSSITFDTNSSLAPLPTRRRRRSAENKEKAGMTENVFEVRKRRIDSAPAQYDSDSGVDEKRISGFLNTNISNQVKKLFTKDMVRQFRRNNYKGKNNYISDMLEGSSNELELHGNSLTRNTRMMDTQKLDGLIVSTKSSTAAKIAASKDRRISDTDIAGRPVTPRALENLSHKTSANKKTRERQIELRSLQRKSHPNVGATPNNKPRGTPFDFLEPLSKLT